ncbi:GIY-YIG nuclease family protein [Nostoc commune]|uniref:GIY-YIG nuclease family protein n=1 Tax=Nostoc commune TaxID=1178 RepID=UPI0018C76AD2|nr:GIY-YIG nuclease family protein [Nostoc commune]
MPLQPLNFATEVNQFDNACIYFILDKALPLILYIGQSKNCSKRLRTLNYSSSGAHHRKKQIELYQQLNQNYGFSSSIYIARWDLPILLEEKYRLELEKSLILKWYPLFNQQNQESILWSNYLVQI